MARERLADFFQQLDEGIMAHYGEMESFYIMYNNTCMMEILQLIGYTQ